ncbi:YdeI/OmpD-associated family protein [Flavobacterium sp. RHBU_24]|uniref:YdeI/OmpD-associated family protein n=1 Tax=Flavobacterium sp. RHBU_24 TaxID=3391185 RepID=UPI003984BA1E
MDEKPKKAWDKSAQWPDEIEKLRQIINKTGLTETTKWGGPMFTYKGKNVLGLGGFKNYVAIWFIKGVFLKDAKGVLLNANEGNTKGLRQWRFTSAAEIDEERVLGYINEAIEVEKAGLAITPDKKETIVPEYLEVKLQADLKLKTAFEGFSAYKQREFCEYIAEAKQEKTQANRFEKIKPMILDGIGLNDRYRK